MANYKISENQAEGIKAKAIILCDNRINYARQDFPLTTEQIEAATVPARERELFAELTSLGVDTVRKYSSIYAATPNSCPGITRQAALRFTAPRAIMSAKERHAYSSVLAEANRLDLSELSPETIAALITWVNGAVREYRLKELVMRTIGGFLGLELPLSTYGLHARWPMLANLLVEFDRGVWHERVSDVPRPSAMNRWRFHSDWSHPDDDKWYDGNRKFMEAADVVLSGAMLIPTVGDKGREHLSVTVGAWEKLPGDKF